MKKKTPPMRICVGCGELRNKKEMLRIVASPEGTIAIDRTGKAARSRCLYRTESGML